MNNPIFYFPGPLKNIYDITGVEFFYFENQLIYPQPPIVVTKESFRLVELVKLRNPKWESILLKILEQWEYQVISSANACHSLMPLKDTVLNFTMLAYSANQKALSTITELLELTDLTYDELYENIDIIDAAGELVRHIFLEMYLECDSSIEKLYSYCDAFFYETNIKRIYVLGYFLRALHYINMENSLLLSNSKLIDVFAKFPLKNDNADKSEICEELIKWELFKQILYPYLNLNDKKFISSIPEILNKKKSQIDDLKAECGALAKQITISSDKFVIIQKEVEIYINNHLKNKISDIIDTKKIDINRIKEKIISDEKFWAGFYSTIYSILSNNKFITAGSAIASLSLITSKTIKNYYENRDAINTNKFRLLYTINKYNK